MGVRQGVQTAVFPGTHTEVGSSYFEIVDVEKPWGRNESASRNKFMRHPGRHRFPRHSGRTIPYENEIAYDISAGISTGC